MEDTGFLSADYKDLNAVGSRLKSKYASANPFPHIILDNIFDEDFLSHLADEFPDLSTDPSSNRFNDSAQIKLATGRGDTQQPERFKQFLRYLNSHSFVDFLQNLTSIRETLIPDPQFIGGGLHQIRRGGLLKVHADFCRHPETGLDRRLNVLIYLNKNWHESYGGYLELWDQGMKSCEERILPVFNRMVVFSTTDFSYHGHPDPVTCPVDRCRRSIALYYYSNGRPREELRPEHWNQSTLFKERPGEQFATPTRRFKSIARALTPPIIWSMLSKKKS
jgi:Rps23 Pro-64 3,4-dihydroxylase Tpa1-like proline 4-hydroxylase